MALGRFLAGIFCVLALGAGAQAAPLEAYGQLPSLDNVTISPDGKNLAVETTLNGQRTIVVNALATNTVIAAIKVGDQKLRGLTWGDNDHLLITLSTTHSALGVMGGRQEYFQTSSYGLSEHLQVQLLKNVSDSMNVTDGSVEPRTVGGRKVVFLTGITFLDRVGVLGLFSVDLDSGRPTLVERGSPTTTGWAVDANGVAVARTDYDQETQRWSLRAKRGTGWQEIYAIEAGIETPSIEGFAPAGDALILSLPQENGAIDKQIGLADGAWQTPPDLAGNGAATIEDPVSHRIIGTQSAGAGTEYHFFDKADQSAWHSVAGAFQGENVTLVSWSDDRKRVVVRVDGPLDGTAYHLVDLNTLHADQIGPVYQAIEPSDVAEVKFITYTAADGTKIPAYLTLPSGRTAKNLPLIVMPHGGPAARDAPGFDWWSQALASRGYAVLQPQFRGSDGFGWDFLAAGFGQWGRKMQTDLSDGVRYLAAQGTIDAKRVCIVGASYGGYAALAGPALDPGVYRCAVADAGISDPRGFLRWRERQDRKSDDTTLRYWSRFMGVANSGDAKLAQISPLEHVASVAVPILLIHGKDDTVVPLQQSEDMEAALRRAGKPVTLVELSGEDHWLSRSDTRLQMLQATVNFLEANNPPN